MLEGSLGIRTTVPGHCRVCSESGELDGSGRKTLVASTTFNLRNEPRSIHQLVFQWGLRLIEERDYSAVLELLETSTRQHILGPGAGTH